MLKERGTAETERERKDDEVSLVLDLALAELEPAAILRASDGRVSLTARARREGVGSWRTLGKRVAMISISSLSGVTSCSQLRKSAAEPMTADMCM